MDPSLVIFIAVLVGVAVGAAIGTQVPPWLQKRKQRPTVLEILIVGPNDAGKTSFWNFLRYQQFADERPTRNTLTVSRQPDFKIARPDADDLPIQNVWDIPGPLEPEEQLVLVREKRPRLLVLIISAENPDGLPWLKRFVAGLRVLLEKDSRLTERLIGIGVILNKIDLISESQCGTRLEAMVKVVDQGLEPVLKTRVRSIAVLPCTLLTGAGAEKAANRLRVTLLEMAHRNQRLVPQ